MPTNRRPANGTDLRLWLAGYLVVATVIFLSQSPGMWNSWRLSQSSERAMAQILDCTGKDGNTAIYLFRAGDRRYQGSGHVYGCSIHGDVKPLEIYYLPEDPTVSTVRNPEHEFSNDLRVALASSLLLPIALGTLLWLQWHRLKGK